jgi:hypothetical protein
MVLVTISQQMANKHTSRYERFSLVAGGSCMSQMPDKMAAMPKSHESVSDSPKKAHPNKLYKSAKSHSAN